MWRFIDERKREQFLNILEQNLKNIDLSAHPEKLLEYLTTATKDSIEKCFPLQKMSNRVKNVLLYHGMVQIMLEPLPEFS